MSLKFLVLRLLLDLFEPSHVGGGLLIRRVCRRTMSEHSKTRYDTVLKIERLRNSIDNPQRDFAPLQVYTLDNCFQL